ncbi:hypothetical protein [Gelidibacter japonicus]|jgi:cyclopropane fatty-acyl-phospholipid synthase-like methyltransferase|uniref:hypothetical protein n=1 Tax=Gelidibacter japonicus TaxID=1962232 RepID=UPI003A9541E2
MKILILLKRVVNKLQNEGLKKTLTGVTTYMYDRYFDAKYQIDTYNWVSKEDLIVEGAVAEHASLYQATRVLPLRKLFKILNLDKNTVLMDIGSGKGRVLLVASEFNFKEVRGIEFSSNLCKIAIKNIENYKSKVVTETTFDIINIDASQYEFRDDESVIFMFNPFGDYILNKVLKNIEMSLKRNERKLLIIYAYPVNRSLIEKNIPIKKIDNYKFWDMVFAVYEL